MTREIALDTETTGLKPAAGHRIVEIGCVELSNRMPTGRSFRRYINPERDMPADAEKVHGLSQDFLADKPLFADIAAAFLDFIGDDPLVIHNAEFDLGFINAELARCGRETLDPARAIDTLPMARKRFPGMSVKLDKLCEIFDIDTSARNKHGALLDAELLAKVYLELTGGRQDGLDLAHATEQITEPGETAPHDRAPPRLAPRHHAPDEAELQAHNAFLAKITAPIWNT